MKYLKLLVTVLIVGALQSQNVGDLVITEIMQNPSAVNDADGEYFEIFNTTTSDIDINGWTISDNDTDFHTISNGGPLVVAANSYFVFGRDGDSTLNGGYNVDYEYSSFILTNTSDEVVLSTPTGLVIDSVAYDDGATFPDPAGASMELIGTSASENDNGANCQTATESYGDGDLGSPGAESSIPVLSIVSLTKSPAVHTFYPNPTTQGFTTVNIDSQNAIAAVIYDLAGQIVLKTNVENRVLDTSLLTSGMYIVQLFETDNKATTIKLMVQ